MAVEWAGSSRTRSRRGRESSRVRAARPIRRRRGVERWHRHPDPPRLRREQARGHRRGGHHPHGAVLLVGPVVYPTNQTNAEHGAHVLDAELPAVGDDPLGTDATGFDMLGRIMYGGQVSLEVGFAAAALIATALGVIWGAVSGFFGGWRRRAHDAHRRRAALGADPLPPHHPGGDLHAVASGSSSLVIGFVAWLVTGPARAW